jgi:hypothetical protein
MTAVCATLLARLIATGLSQPANLSAVASSEIRIDLSWQETSSTETGFEVRRSATGPTGIFTLLAVTGANVTQYTDGGLSASTQYCYRLAAFKTKGARRDYSDPSAPACATTFQPPTPAAPANVLAVPSSDSQIDVAWQDRSSNETGFEIHRSADGPAGAFVLVASTGAGVTARSDMGLNASTQYCYQVRAFNIAGGTTSYSAFSPAACATTLAPVPPAAPSNTRVYTASSSSIAVYWQDNSTSETGFEIQRSADGPTGVFALVAAPGPNTTEAMDPGLTASTQYCYKVRAARMGGGTTAYSDFSNTSCATTSPPPAPPGLHVKTVTTGVDLDADGYQVDVWEDWGGHAWLYRGWMALPVNGTVTVPGLDSGSDYELDFSGTSINCNLTSRWALFVHLGMPWEPGVTAEFDVSCAPARQLAYANTAGGNTDIYLIKSNGDAGARLTSDPAIDKAPAWSPDGTKIAFESDRGGAFEIYVMNADGSNPVQITSTGGSFRPAWSPDGTRIAFSSPRDGKGEIYAVNVDGTGLVNLTNDELDDGDAAWSPDGTKIAFRKGDPFSSNIYVMSTDGSGATQLTTDPLGTDAGPAWFPDGSALAISRWWCGADWTCGQAIWVVTVADGVASLVATPQSGCENYSDPAWSREYDIAFTATDFCSGDVGTVKVGYGTGIAITDGFSPSWRP